MERSRSQRKEATATMFWKVLERLQKWKLDHDETRANTAQETADQDEQSEDQTVEISRNTVEAQEIVCNEVADEDVLKDDSKHPVEANNSRFEEYVEDEGNLKTSTPFEEEDAHGNLDDRIAFANAVNSRLGTEILRRRRELDVLFDSGYSTGYSSGEDSDDLEIAEAEVAVEIEPLKEE